VLFLGVLYCVLAVLMARKLGGRAVWIGWFLLSVGAASAMAWSTFQALGGSSFLLFVIAWSTIGIPTGLATLTVWRDARRATPASPTRATLVAFAVLVVSIPLGAIVAMIPDFVRFMAR